MSMILSLPMFSALFATGSACAAVLNVEAVQIESPTAKVFNDRIFPVSFAAGFLVRGEESFDDWVYWFFKSQGEANLTMLLDRAHT